MISLRPTYYLFVFWLALSLMACPAPSPEPAVEVTETTPIEFEINAASSPCEIPAGGSIQLTVDSKDGTFLPSNSTVSWQSEPGTFSPMTGTLTSYRPHSVVSNTQILIQATLMSDEGDIPLSIGCLLKGDPVKAAEAATINQVPPTKTSTPSPSSTPLPSSTPDDESESEPTAAPVTPEPTSTPDDEPTAEPITPESTAEPITPESTPVPMTPEEVVALFQQRGYFMAGVREDTPPFGMDPDGSLVEDFTPEGFDIDIVREFAWRWVGDPNAARLVAVPAQERVTVLEERKVELLAAAMGHTIRRCGRVDCTQTYVIDGPRLLVRSDSQINDLCELNGKVVSVLEGTTAQGYMQTELSRSCTYQIYPQVLPYSTREQAIDAVVTGVVDAYTTDGIILEEYAKDNPNLKVVADEFAREDFRMAVPKGDQGLLELMNLTLQEMKEDGTYDALYEKWFGCRNAPFLVKIDTVARPDFVKRDDISWPASDCSERADPTVDTEYVIQYGETLGAIALRHYGEFQMYVCIQEASGITNVRAVSIGTLLKLPSLEECQSLLASRQ